MATQASQLQRDQFNESNYKEFFSRLTGKEPYSYQTNLARVLTQGKSVILRAPTGSGKTWATVAPFIYSCLAQNKLADRLIYALPLRSLASNLHESTTATLKKVQEFHGRVCSSANNRRYRPDDPFYLSLQMGGQQDDPFFEGDITFTTIDQLLSAYLFAPVSLPARVGNIGAGALIGSFLVFDEVHLLDPERSLGTTVEMLVRLKGLAQFVLMTATMPDSVMEWLAKKLDAEQLSLSDEEVRQLPSHAAKQREFEWHSSPMTADDIVGQHKNRTIAIVNTVGRAQGLYREVCQKVESLSNPPRVLLLHSRFFKRDREHWELQLNDYFGPDANSGNAILISTQVVEAGIDISADLLLTELAPLNSLLQRAGRCARYAKPRNVGKLLIFDLLKDDHGRSKLGPYRNIAEIVSETQKLLEAKSKLPWVDYVAELEWLERVHHNPDLEALRPLNSLSTRTAAVLKAMDGQDDAVLQRLVRETGSINVVLTSRPEELQFSSKKWPELLSLPRISLFRLKDVCAQSSEWVLKVPEEIESESNQRLNFKWREIKNPAAVSWLVVINPKFASYSSKVGLELGKPSGEETKICYKDSPAIPRYSYQKESFVTHAKRVAKRGARILKKYSCGLSRLERRYRDISNIREIHLLACALHDTGKLQVKWQSEAERWQRDKDAELKKPHHPELLAHTDYDPERDKGKPLPDFPPHAACGGFALLPYFAECFSEIALLLCTAITRHHGTHTSNLNRYELMAEAAGLLEQCLPDAVPRCISIYLKSPNTLTGFEEDCLLHMTEQDNFWPLYVNVIRILRLADQGSFQD